MGFVDVLVQSDVRRSFGKTIMVPTRPSGRIPPLRGPRSQEEALVCRFTVAEGQEEMTIYRIQDKDGRGPWRPGFSHKWLEDRPDHDNLKAIYEEFPECMTGLDRNFHHGVGCTDIAQLQRWFTESEYKKLRMYGFMAKEMEGEILYQSETQCLFRTAKPIAKLGKPFILYK